MAGTFTILSLGDGQLPLSKGTLYTVPASAHSIIKTISIVNSAVSDANINLYVNNTGTSRRLIPKNMLLAINFSLEADEEYTLPPGATIEGDSTVSGVDYSIHGVQEN